MFEFWILRPSVLTGNDISFYCSFLYMFAVWWGRPKTHLTHFPFYCLVSIQNLFTYIFLQYNAQSWSNLISVVKRVIWRESFGRLTREEYQANIKLQSNSEFLTARYLVIKSGQAGNLSDLTLSWESWEL